MRDLQTMTRGYIEAALWADLFDSEGNTLDEYTYTDVEPKSRNTAEAICASFLVDTVEIDTSEWTDEELGRDLWFTSQGHGTGFWDRGREAGQLLTDIARRYMARDIYAGDDGEVYID